MTTPPRAPELAAALREAIKAAPLSVRQLGAALGKSHTTISQWSNGHRVPTEADVAALVALLDLPQAEVERIAALAEEANMPLSDRLIAGVSEAQGRIMDFEQRSVRIVEWNGWLVPGLLQTSEYARAVIGGDADLQSAPHSHAALHLPLALRAGRREVLTRAENPPHFIALLGEHAVRWCIGTPTVRNHQLRHLLKMAELDNVTIQVVPNSHDFHPGLVNSFVVYEFPVERPSVVLLEHYRSSGFLHNEEHVADYQAAAEVIRGRAISPEETVKLIAACIE